MTAKFNRLPMIFVWLIILGISLFTTITIFTDKSRPYYYEWLFLLPLSYTILTFISVELYENISKNIGMAIIIILFFMRMVASPLAMYYGGYQVTITKNIDNNTLYAILLIIYEAIAVFVTLLIRDGKKKEVDHVVYENYTLTINTRYKVLIFAALMAFLFCLRLTPQFMDIYRPISEITDEHFANYEDAYVVAKYSTSFVSKLSMVTGTYLSRVLLLLLPAFMIVWLAGKKTFIRKLLALLLCFIPLFYIAGAIAQSLIYILCLIFLYNYMFNPKKANNKTMVLLALGGLVVAAWWIFKGDSIDFYGQLSERLSAYFSGVNIVSGAFNMPRSLDYRIRYFLYDFASTFPYGNTIFGLSGDTIQPFFNEYNNSMGQIPTTIGMGYYYFGPILAPLYSIIFANVSFDAGISLNKNLHQNPMKCIRYLITAFYFSMGIVMYNIEITMTYFFCLILPMYLLEKIAYTKEY